MSLQAELYARDLGLNRVEQTNDEWVVMARREAVRICAKAGRVSVNELHDWAEATGIVPEAEGAYSAVFRGKEWKPTGQTVPARHKGSHGRRVMYFTYESTVY